MADDQTANEVATSCHEPPVFELMHLSSLAADSLGPLMQISARLATLSARICG